MKKSSIISVLVWVIVAVSAKVNPNWAFWEAVGIGSFLLVSCWFMDGGAG